MPRSRLTREQGDQLNSLLLLSSLFRAIPCGGDVGYTNGYSFTLGYWADDYY